MSAKSSGERTKGISELICGQQNRDSNQKEVRWGAAATVSPVVHRPPIAHFAESPMFLMRRSHPPVGGGRALSRSKSESQAFNTEHSNAGHVTPGPAPLKVACPKQYTTPNAMVQKVISGKDGIDWGVSKAADAATIERMLEILEQSAGRNRTLLRRHVSMDDKLLQKSPIQFGKAASGTSVISPAVSDPSIVRYIAPLSPHIFSLDSSYPSIAPYAENARSQFRQAVGTDCAMGFHEPLRVAGVDKKQQKRIADSHRIKRRMSHVMNRGGMVGLRESLCSPATPAKFPRGKTSATEMFEKLVTSQNSQKSFREILLSDLTVLSFKCNVIGGVYQHNFDANRPVIASCGAKDSRVVAVQQTDTEGVVSLDLKIYSPTEKRFAFVSLGPNWVWSRTAPDGYLVSSERIRRDVHSEW